MQYHICVYKWGVSITTRARAFGNRLCNDAARGQSPSWAFSWLFEIANCEQFLSISTPTASVKVSIRLENFTPPRILTSGHYWSFQCAIICYKGHQFRSLPDENVQSHPQKWCGFICTYVYSSGQFSQASIALYLRVHKLFSWLFLIALVQELKLTVATRSFILGFVRWSKVNPTYFVGRVFHKRTKVKNKKN